jgi:hypothetical protein
MSKHCLFNIGIVVTCDLHKALHEHRNSDGHLPRIRQHPLRASCGLSNALPTSRSLPRPATPQAAHKNRTRASLRFLDARPSRPQPKTAVSTTAFAAVGHYVRQDAQTPRRRCAPATSPEDGEARMWSRPMTGNGLPIFLPLEVRSLGPIRPEARLSMQSGVGSKKTG